MFVRFLHTGFIALALLGLTSCEDKTLSLDGYEKALAKSGIQTGPREPQMFQLIGAKNGYGFSVEGDGRCSGQYLCRCEVYEFDTSIASGRKALETVQREGIMGTRLDFNKNVGIFCQGDNPQTKRAIEVLMTMK